jgi:hypothetical protein
VCGNFLLQSLYFKQKNQLACGGYQYSNGKKEKKEKGE